MAALRSFSHSLAARASILLMVAVSITSAALYLAHGRLADDGALTAPVSIASAALYGSEAATASDSSAGAPFVGVFTGEFDRGVPIYRFPSISVTADSPKASVSTQAQPRVAERRTARTLDADGVRATSATPAS